MSCVVVNPAPGVACIGIDDGRVNALTDQLVAAIAQSLEVVFEESQAVVLTGRLDCFSAGLDRRSMISGSQSERVTLLSSFSRLLGTILLYPRPVVAAVTGHAIAGGMMLAIACDEVVASSAPSRWGLVETSLGVAQEQFGLALARYRLGPIADRWALRGKWLTPQDVFRAGGIDELVDPEDVQEAALARAVELAKIDQTAYSLTKLGLHQRLCADMCLGSSSECVGATNVGKHADG